MFLADATEIDAAEKEFIPKDMKYIYKFFCSDDTIAYLTNNGVILIIFSMRKKGVSWKMARVYTFQDFRIISKYRLTVSNDKNEISTEGEDYYNFVLNYIGTDELFEGKSRVDMIKIIQDKCLDQPRNKNYLNTLMNVYIQHERIEQVKTTTYMGFAKDGWRMPDKFFMVTGNKIRELGYHCIKETFYRNHSIGPFSITGKIPGLFNFGSLENAAKFAMRAMYDLTKVDNKDFLFAFMPLAVFNYALRDIYKLMPVFGFGGEGGKGKSSACELMAVKMWGHTKGVLGTSGLSTLPKFEANMTISTFPVIWDECADIPAFVVELAKRYHTEEDGAQKLNPDQSIKYRAPFCSALILNYNDYPILFDDPNMRQRIFNMIATGIEKNEDWLDMYNSISDGLMGRLVYEKTKNWTLKDIEPLLRNQPDLGLEDRAKIICKFMHLGKYLMKWIFDIDLDLTGIKRILRESQRAGNEVIISLLKNQIAEGTAFVVNNNGVMENPYKVSWVKTRVHQIRHKGDLGVVYMDENAFDLAKRLGRLPKDIGLNRLHGLISTQWKIKSGVFNVPSHEPRSVRGIFIPETEYNGVKEENEIGDDIAEIGNPDEVTQPDLFDFLQQE